MQGNEADGETLASKVSIKGAWLRGCREERRWNGMGWDERGRNETGRDVMGWDRGDGTGRAEVGYG